MFKVCGDGGFTLVELVSVLVLLAVISIYVLPKYKNVINDSYQKSAISLIAAAQSQLSLEYSRRMISGNSLAISSQNVCDMIALSGGDANVTCSGNLSDTNVSITATVEGQSANANWFSPQSGS